MDYRRLLSKKFIITGAIILFILVCVVLLIIQALQPKIVSYTPKDEATNVGLSDSINLVFNRELNNSEKEKINVFTTPSTDLSTSWARKQLIIAAKNKFTSNVKYKINVMFGNQVLLSFSFTTIPFDQSEVDKAGAIQTTNDYVFGQSYIQFLDKNPWYVYLPINTDQYTVVYDFDKKSFRIRIKIATTDVQKNDLVTQVLAKLKSIGVTADPIPYYVLTP